MICKKYINMDKEFFDENLLLLLFQLLKFRKLRKSKCKKIYIRRRPPKFWVQNIFNYNLQQNLSFFSTPPGIIYRVGSSHHRCAVKIGVLRNSTKFTRKHLCQSLFFNKVSGLRPATLFKKWLYHRCFPVNFVKFLRTHFYIEHLWWLLFPCLSENSENTENSFTVSESCSSSFMLRYILCINFFRFAKLFGP